MQISEHSVRERAYYIWEDEGRVHGRAAAHWIRAEDELRAVAAPRRRCRARRPRYTDATERSGHQSL